VSGRASLELAEASKSPTPTANAIALGSQRAEQSPPWPTCAAAAHVGRGSKRVLASHHGRAKRGRTCEERAGATGLEPATSGVTGRRSNQLNYAPRGRPVYLASQRSETASSLLT
jgi:hypothetical protein